MQTKIVIPTSKKSEIDWNKIQIVRSKTSHNYYLTTGKDTTTGGFSAVCIVSNTKDIKVGDFAQNWDKSEIQKVDSPITIEFKF